MAIIGVERNDDNKALEWRMWKTWLAGLLDSDDSTIETDYEDIDTNNEDIDSLHNLDVTNTVRWGKHVKNRALQNVFKIYNQWSQHQKKIYQV